jgi:hypothetical protein
MSVSSVEVEAQIAQFAELAVAAIDSARSRMTQEQVIKADRKTREMLPSVSRTKQ